MDESPIFQASGHLGTELLGALLDEIKALPNVWQALPEADQQDVIDRIRLRVESSVTRAVTIIAADGRVAVPAQLVQVTFKNDIEGKLKLPKSTPYVLDLADHAGQPVLLVITNPAQYVEGIDEIKADKDQGDLIEGAADALWFEAVSVARSSENVSISRIHRELRIGYNRAARIVEAMESAGMVSSADGDGARKWIGD